MHRDGVLPIEIAVIEDDAHRIKLSHHRDSFVQFQITASSRAVTTTAPRKALVSCRGPLADATRRRRMSVVPTRMTMRAGGRRRACTAR
jgi:hypothetical protein